MAKKLTMIMLCVETDESITSQDLREMLTNSPKAKEHFDQMGMVVFSANAQEVTNDEFLEMSAGADNFPEGLKNSLP